LYRNFREAVKGKATSQRKKFRQKAMRHVSSGPL